MATRYYALLRGDATPDRPSGLMRVTQEPGFLSVEAFHADYRWHEAPDLVKYVLDRGDDDPVEVSEERAGRIVERWKAEGFGPGGD